MLRRLNPNRWLALACIYVAWNLNGYLAQHLYGNSIEWYDYSYWLFERLFVAASFWAVLPLVLRPYKWVIKTFLWVAIWKFGYILLVATQVIKRNDWWSLMGIGFIITIGVISLIWEKRQQG